MRSAAAAAFDFLIFLEFGKYFLHIAVVVRSVLQHTSKLGAFLLFPRMRENTIERSEKKNNTQHRTENEEKYPTLTAGAHDRTNRSPHNTTTVRMTLKPKRYALVNRGRQPRMMNFCCHTTNRTGFFFYFVSARILPLAIHKPPSNGCTPSVDRLSGIRIPHGPPKKPDGHFSSTGTTIRNSIVKRKLKFERKEKNTQLKN